jgi:hypothetical protein
MGRMWIWTVILAAGVAAASEVAPGEPNAAAGSTAEQHPPSRFEFGAEIRGRAEGFDGISYVPGWHDAYYLHRLRLNAKLRIAPCLRTFIQVQDSQAPGYSRKPVPTSVANTLDLRQGYVELGVEEGNGWRVRVGRQLLVFGDMRLVSTSNWGNVGPAYDAARISYKTSKTRLDWFASSVVTPVAGQFDRPRGDRRLHGFYSAFDGLVPRSTLEAYFFVKDNQQGADTLGRVGRLTVYTYGAHWSGKLPYSFDYNIETAGQAGHIAASAMRAWGGHWEIGYTTGAAPTAPRFLVEYNYASGDGNPADGVVRTFDNLYPTDKYGTADGLAWRNIHEPIVSVEWKPARKWKTKTCYHSFWLAERQDALYAIAGSILAHNPAATSSYVGGEFDVRVIYQHSSRMQLWGGYGYFIPGTYVKQSSRGSGIHYPYLMWTYTL